MGPVYTVDSTRSEIEITATSNVHNFTIRIPAISGTIVKGSDGWQIDLRVDMQRADAGDFLRNRKLHQVLASANFPTAHFKATSVVFDETIKESNPSGQVSGEISWRERRVKVDSLAEAAIKSDSLQGKARLEMLGSDLGISPPKILMFRVDDRVAIAVSIYAVAQKDSSPSPVR